MWKEASLVRGGDSTLQAAVSCYSVLSCLAFCRCKREKLPFSLIGKVDGSGRIKVVDSSQDENSKERVIEDLLLEDVLGDMPRKKFCLKSSEISSHILKIPQLEDDSTIDVVGAVVLECYTRICSLISVCSKRFLTTKVDRCVTGLVAQQQCVGPLQVSSKLILLIILAQEWLSFSSLPLTASVSENSADSHCRLRDNGTELLWAHRRSNCNWRAADQGIGGSCSHGANDLGGSGDQHVLCKYYFSKRYKSIR